MTSKVCSKCNIDKDLGEFHKDKSRKDGYRNACKECKNSYSKQYRIDNRESISANKKEYREKNTEVIKERKKNYYEKKKLEKKNEEKLEVNSKNCSRCNIDKDIVEFHKDHRRKDGHKSICEECAKIVVNAKKCFKCNVDKDINDFRKDHRRLDGHESICKECRNPSKKSKIPVIELDPTQKLCPLCKIVKQVEMFSKHKARSDGLQRECKECWKKHYNSNKANILEQQKSESSKTRRRQREKNKRHSDEAYNLECILRKRLASILRFKRCRKTHKTFELIGCSTSSVHLYLNQKNNIDNQYDIDHIIPCSAFDFTNSDHQKACFHYTNLQKLPSRENQHRKRNKLPEDFNIDFWVEKQLEQIKRIEDENLGWETVLDMQRNKIFQGFVDEEDKWW